MFLLAELPQRETFYPIRAHQKVIDQNQNQNQTFDDRSIFAEILKTDRRARFDRGKLSCTHLRIDPIDPSNLASAQFPFHFSPPRLPVPRIDGLATGSRKIWSGKKKEKKEGVRVELAGSLLVNHAMTNYRCIDAGKRAEDRSIEAVPVARFGIRSCQARSPLSQTHYPRLVPRLCSFLLSLSLSLSIFLSTLHTSPLLIITVIMARINSPCTGNC